MAILVKSSSKPSGGGEEEEEEQKKNNFATFVLWTTHPQNFLTLYILCLCPFCWSNGHLYALHIFVNTSLDQPHAATQAKVYLHICIIPIKNVHCLSFVTLSLLESVLLLIHGLYPKNNECSMHATCVFWVSYFFFGSFLPSGIEGWGGTVLSKLRQSAEIQKDFRPTSSSGKDTQLLSQYLLCGPDESPPPLKFSVRSLG